MKKLTMKQIVNSTHSLSNYQICDIPKLNSSKVLFFVGDGIIVENKAIIVEN